MSHTTVTSSGGPGEGMSEMERRGQTMTTKEKHHVEWYKHEKWEKQRVVCVQAILECLKNKGMPHQIN